MEKDRRRILAAFTFTGFIQGAPYIWTVFQPYAQSRYHLSLALSSLPFTLMSATFAVGNLAGGYLHNRVGARALIFWGNILLCAGLAMAALAPSDMAWLLFAGFGVLGGLGSGCAFNALIVTAQAWFPDKKGLITGVTIGTIGVSSALMNPICDCLLSKFGYRPALLIAAFVYTIFSLSALYIRKVPDSQFTFGAAQKSATEGSSQFTPSQMVHTVRFRAITAIMAFLVMPYVIVSPLVKSMGLERGLTDSQALCAVVVFSTANVVGRFAIPGLSDLADKKVVVRLLCVVSAAVAWSLSLANGFFYIFFAAVISMLYGGVSGIFSVLAGEYFGTEHQGSNMGILMLGTSAASTLCPVLLQFATWNQSLFIIGILCSAGLFLVRYL